MRAALPQPVRKGFAFPETIPKRAAARLSLAAMISWWLHGKAEPFRKECGKAAEVRHVASCDIQLKEPLNCRTARGSQRMPHSTSLFIMVLLNQVIGRGAWIRH